MAIEAAAPGRRAGVTGWALPVGIVAAGFLFLAVYPYFKLVHVSVEAANGRLTLAHYVQAIGQSYLLLDPLIHSLATSVAIAVSATAIGTALAWLAVRSDLPGARWIGAVAPIPHVIPSFQLASAWIMIFTENGLLQSFSHHASPLPAYGGIAIWLVLTLHLYLFAFLTVAGALGSLDPSLEEAARIAGLGRARVFLKVTLPLVRPALLSGLLLGFAYGMQEFGAPSLLGSPTGFTTLTMQIYELATTPPLDFQTASVLSVILGAIALLVLLLNLRLVAKGAAVTVGGKAARRNLARLGGWRWPLAALTWGFLLLTSLGPLVALLLVSFIDSWGNGYGPSNLTFTRYLALIQSPELRTAIWNTLYVALAAAALATLVGLISAYAWLRLRRRWAAWMDRVSFVAFATPGLVLGLALIVAFSGGPINLYGTYAILIIAYMVRFSGIAVRTIGANLAQISPELESAARVCGLAPPRVLLRITLPLIKHGVAVAFILAFINGVKEISATSLLVSQGHETLAYEAYLRYMEGNYTLGSAISIGMIVLTLAVVVAVARWAKVGLNEVAK